MSTPSIPQGVPDRARLESIFHAAADAPPSDRAAVLDRLCAAAPHLRPQVESLLAQHDRATAQVLAPQTPLIGSPGYEAERVGEVVGRYTLQGVLGEGGFGMVYIAHQSEPVKREVALKILKAGMDSRAVLSRFEAERQTLAMMDHPSIAKVLDAGATPRGRPFFVMELVRGEPLTQFCDAGQLELDERLNLFVQVCHAVQHAHQKGIIHRDLKPSNVLVISQDGKPLPKVIDFGIAKALHQPLLEASLATQQGQIIGTPEYMAPEQAGGDGAALDVDTRADVYSLGVMLYELVVGVLPFDSGSLRSKGFAAMQQMIRTAEPPRPSTRLSSLGDLADESARRRRLDRVGLLRRVRGDLEWIIIKSIEKDRSRRYDSVSALIADIQRHLRHEPVAASPPSRVYRLSKFVRRNRVAVAAGLAVFLALSAGLASAAVGFVRAREERDRAVLAEREARAQERATQQARDEARAEARKAQEVTNFLKDMLSSVRPSQARGREVTVLSVLDEASRTIESKFEGAPDVRSELELTIGTVYRVLERLDEAEAHLSRAVTARESYAGTTAPTTSAARLQWAQWLVEKGRHAEAVDITRGLVELARAATPLDEMALADALEGQARACMGASKWKDAEPIIRECLAFRSKLEGERSADVAEMLDMLGRCLSEQSRKEEALVELHRAREIRQSEAGRANPGLGSTLNNIAGVYHDLGRYDEAELMYKESLDIAEKVSTRISISYAQPLNNLAMLYQDKGDMASAEVKFKESLEVRRKVYGEDHPSVAHAMSNYGGFLVYAGRLEEAVPLFEQANALQARVLGPTHAQTISSLGNLAAVLLRLHRFDEALPIALDANARARLALGPEHRQSLTTMLNVVTCLRNVGEFDLAERMLLELLEIRTRTLGDLHPDTQLTRRTLAYTYLRAKRFELAERWIAEVCEIDARREKPLPSEERANRNLTNDFVNALAESTQPPAPP